MKSSLLPGCYEGSVELGRLVMFPRYSGNRFTISREFIGIKILSTIQDSFMQERRP